ncbi:MAG: radical SAM protein [Armatimonadetes bacterium]|nr:radical SAM protein [Armatimonadota bacterium]
MSAQMALFELESGLNVPDRIGHARVSRRRVRQILTKPTGVLAGLDFTLNPYGGCSFGCAYCYAAFFQPDEAKAADWGNWVEVKENALDLLRGEPGLAGSRLLIGSVTDPYQPLERKTGLTRSLLEHMAKLSPQPRVIVQTRSPIVVQDIDVLLRFKDLRVNMSVTTDDDAVRKRYEPLCASIGRRLDAVRRLSESGVRAGLSLAPLLPISNVGEFAKTINKLGIESAWTGYFHPGTRRFASGTRENALVLAKEDGWNFERYLETVSELRKLVPVLKKYNEDEKAS